MLSRNELSVWNTQRSNSVLNVLVHTCLCLSTVYDLLFKWNALVRKPHKYNKCPKLSVRSWLILWSEAWNHFTCIRCSSVAWSWVLERIRSSSCSEGLDRVEGAGGLSWAAADNPLPGLVWMNTLGERSRLGATVAGIRWGEMTYTGTDKYYSSSTVFCCVWKLVDILMPAADSFYFSQLK